MEIQGVTAYVLPTVPLQPPSAILFHIGTVEDEEMPQVCGGHHSVWSSDSGCWLIEGEMAPPLVSELLTEHARSLGVNL